MSPPRRRSSRLRGSSATPGKSTIFSSNRLTSLAERDESSTSGTNSNFDTVTSSPLAPRTPTTAARLKPSMEEMHPSKVQQSTTSQPDSGLRLGFTNIAGDGCSMPSRTSQQTPSKTPHADSSFNFRFARPRPELGPEAQRMMDELHEEALRIKANLAAERARELTAQGGDAGGIEGRKIALPKGKVGRFSDIHMAEFKKMDSIAGHPSAFRGPSRPATPVKTGLKRTQSKAKLDDRADEKRQDEGQLSNARSMASDRLENTAPAKRVRKAITDDTSTARPISRESKPLTPRSQFKTLGYIATPTQSSLARASSTKVQSSHIPTLSRSPSKPKLVTTPRVLTKSASVNDFSAQPRSESKIFMRSPNRIDRLKSILRHPSASAKKPAAVASAIPSFARSPVKPDYDKALPSIPTTPTTTQRPKSAKQVNFTPETVKKHAATVLQNSPSPVKSGIPRSISKINFRSKASPNTQSIRPVAGAEVTYPHLANHPSLEERLEPVEYPSLADVRATSEPMDRDISVQENAPSVPGTFTFRSDHTINFGRSPTGFGSSPGQSSVRQVRPSIFSSMPGSFPASVDKENAAPVPSLSHGMPNKKRRRVESDDESMEEVQHSPKKHKPTFAAAPVSTTAKVGVLRKAPPSSVSSPVKKRGLSLSRLNMLARPKVRK